MYHSFCIHSFVDGHLGCFHVLPIIKSNAKDSGVQTSLSIMVFSGLVVGLLGRIVVLFLVFEGISTPFSYVQGCDGDTGIESRFVDTVGEKVGRVERVAWKHIHPHV